VKKLYAVGEKMTEKGGLRSESMARIAVKEPVLERLKVLGRDSAGWDDILSKAIKIILEHAPQSAESPALGTDNAPIQIYEYSDFECYYCGEVLPKVKKILDTYGGKVKVTFKHFPRTLKHPNALDAHIASMCAQRQGRFWEYHDELFKHQDRLSKEILVSIAEKLSLDMDAFCSCFQEEINLIKILRDKEEGYQAGVQRVPTFIINDVKIVGNVPYDEFKAVIEDIING
jgi:protein-disulfide isomerase